MAVLTAAGHHAPARLDLKRKAEALPTAGEEAESVSTIHIRPGGSSVVAAPGAQEAAALKLRLSNASLAQTKAVHQTLDEEGGPLAVEVSGFSRAELNGRYAVRQDALLHGRRTYWTQRVGSEPSRFFLAWQKALGRWVVCEMSCSGPDADKAAPQAEELERCCRWQAFQLDQPGTQSWTWVRLLEEGRWMERRDAGWGRALAVRVSPAPPRPMAAPRPQLADSRPAAVDFSGFHRLELNARYSQRRDLVLQGRPTYWAASGRFFIYWQSGLRRWAICGKALLDAARQGQCPGCACQLDLVHFAQPGRWVEHVDGRWLSVPAEAIALSEEADDAPAAAERGQPSGG